MNKKNIITILVILIVAFVSYKIGQSNAPAPAATAGGAQSAYSGRGAGRGAGAAGTSAVTGSVLSVDGTSMTIQLRGSGSQIVFISASSTRISKLVDGSVSDLAPGSQVVVMGTPNSDGSFSGTSVQIRPSQPSASSAQN